RTSRVSSSAMQAMTGSTSSIAGPTETSAGATPRRVPAGNAAGADAASAASFRAKEGGSTMDLRHLSAFSAEVPALTASWQKHLLDRRLGECRLRPRQARMRLPPRHFGRNKEAVRLI